MRTHRDPRHLLAIDPSWRVGIVHSEFYPKEISALIEGARNTLLSAGLPPSHVTMWPAPGSFEIPLIGRALAKEGTVDGLIALGIIVEGETHHAELLAREVVRGIMDVQTAYGIPFAFEVLYVRDLGQVQERVYGPQNKGREAASTLLSALAALQKIQSRGLEVQSASSVG